MTVRGHRRRSLTALSLLLPVLIGCSNWRVGRESVPAHCVKPGLFDNPRSSKEPINYLRLRQDPPAEYRLGPRDVLGLHIENVLGRSDTPIPVHYSDQQDVPPSIGYPVPVEENGVIDLPYGVAVQVTGLTLSELRDRIREEYTVKRDILKPGKDRIIVTLMEPRTYHVLVVREDAGTPREVGQSYRPGEIIQEPRKRGRTYAVELRAYENDVLHALTEGGGLPGVDAKHEIKILRGTFTQAEEQDQYLNIFQEGEELGELVNDSPNVTTIPLRVGPNAPPPQFSQRDVILQTGDVVVVQSRESEVFYTGGLLQGGQFAVPRDYDLDVLGAIAMAGGSIAAAAGGSGTMGSGGRGGTSSIFPPTRVTVLRTVNGKQVPIRIDLKRAITDPSQRILIQPNDFVLLEFTRRELIANLITGNVWVNLGLSGKLWD